MKYENLSFQEAQETLARQYGMEIIRQDSGKRTGHFDALSKLAEYYQRNLQNSKTALQYLHNRGMTDNVIEEFKLGYSEGPRQPKVLKNNVSRRHFKYRYVRIKDGYFMRCSGNHRSIIDE
jgi:DNA primase